MEWYGHFDGHPPLVLVHGEDKAREALAGEIGERNGVCRATCAVRNDVSRLIN